MFDKFFDAFAKWQPQQQLALSVLSLLLVVLILFVVVEAGVRVVTLWLRKDNKDVPTWKDMIEMETLLRQYRAAQKAKKEDKTKQDGKLE